MNTTSNPSWITRDLLPLNACPEAVREARKYPDPQSAWDAWTSADELIWALLKLRANPCQLILCCCELIEPVLDPMFSEIDDTDAETIYRGAFDAVRNWATNPTCENLKRVDYFYDDVVDWRCPNNCPIAAYTGKAIEKILRAVERPRKLIDLPDTVKNAVYYTLHDGWTPSIVPGIANVDLTESQYTQWQCDTVRRFFPITPSIKAYS
jgi:hypothetical protein